jgi:glycosyltransferase involved in cell wall biosynthesis
LKITVSHAGKQHSYHLARSLKQLGFLDKFYTSSYVSPLWLQQYFTKTNNTFFNRRYLAGLGGKFVDANWGFELKEVYLRARYGKTQATQDAVYQRDVNFDRYVAGCLAKRKSEVYWGFQGSSHDSLLAAKKANKLAVVELATAHVVAAKRILGEEALLHPEWADSIDNLVFPSFYQKRLEAEPHQADLVISASKFTTSTLLEDGISPDRIKLLPLGFELEHIPYIPKDETADKYISKRPLRLLYAGNLTQRKGLMYLLEALRAFPKGEVELHIIGGVQGSGAALKQYEGEYHYHGRVSQYEMFQAYGNYDALVLPTVFEGFGLVIVEAMAAGLPVITTAHSMGPDVIEDGVSGYIVPIRDIQALESAIGNIRQLSDQQYWEMSAAARASVLNFTWQVYTQNLHKLVTTAFRN